MTYKCNIRSSIYYTRSLGPFLQITKFLDLYKLLIYFQIIIAYPFKCRAIINCANYFSVYKMGT